MILRKRRKKSAFKTLNLMSDPGPNYRGYEATYHYLVTLAHEWQAKVLVHYGWEKRSKSICDRLFGWMSAYVEKTKQNQRDILSLEEQKMKSNVGVIPPLRALRLQISTLQGHTACLLAWTSGSSLCVLGCECGITFSAPCLLPLKLTSFTSRMWRGHLLGEEVSGENGISSLLPWAGMNTLGFPESKLAKAICCQKQRTAKGVAHSICKRSWTSEWRSSTREGRATRSGGNLWQTDFEAAMAMRVPLHFHLIDS